MAKKLARGGRRDEVPSRSILTRAVDSVFDFVRLAEFEILFVFFFVVAYVIFKDLGQSSSRKKLFFVLLQIVHISINMPSKFCVLSYPDSFSAHEKVLHIALERSSYSFCVQHLNPQQMDPISAFFLAKISPSDVLTKLLNQWCPLTPSLLAIATIPYDLLTRLRHGEISITPNLHAVDLALHASSRALGVCVGVVKRV
ncbi:hypothetical protein MTR67_012954 [Solanum verrucosum]|uniref:Uncharacterized protein n=1 Tax=Solanum verrucosum TaxID=315347 RepID=A0AAF0THZ0_SOLVR|nr:hypothetical protein MTR67_012954 [Solanum verrucosum]